MAQAVPADTRSTFLAKILAPLPHAISRRALLEWRRDLEDAWSVAYHRYYAIEALERYHSHICHAVKIERKVLTVPEQEEQSRAHLARVAAADRLMMTPAPTTVQLNMKRKMRGFNGGRDRWETAIAADEARLAAEATTERARRK